MKNVIFGVGIVVALLSIAGCASKEILDINQRLTSPDLARKSAPDALYVVDPPDAISIEFLGEGIDVAGRSAQLRQDGTITLPYLEDVKVGGMTTVAIREKLESLYAKYYKKPKILVSVVGYNSKHVYVYGEVAGGRGAVPYTGSQTVTDVIGQVGGITPRSAPWRVRVIRGDLDEKEVFKVNLKKLIYEGETRQNVSLAENDVLYVPPNALAWVGYQIDNLLFPFRSVFAAVGTARTATTLGDGF